MEGGFVPELEYRSVVQPPRVAPECSNHCSCCSTNISWVIEIEHMNSTLSSAASLSSAECLGGVIPWLPCSGGGTCVTNNVTDSVSNVTSVIHFCVCDSGFSSVVPLWFNRDGDCYVHGQGRDVLLWIALVSCGLGCMYALLRVAFGVPRGARGCFASMLAAASLGYSCSCCPLDRVTGTAYSSSNTSRHNKPGHSPVDSNSRQYQNGRLPMKAVDWQILGARGLPIYVAIALGALTLYFLGAVSAPGLLKVC